jgi:hypothetical protein
MALAVVGQDSACGSMRSVDAAGSVLLATADRLVIGRTENLRMWNRSVNNYFVEFIGLMCA